MSENITLKDMVMDVAQRVDGESAEHIAAAFIPIIQKLRVETGTAQGRERIALAANKQLSKKIDRLIKKLETGK